LLKANEKVVLPTKSSFGGSNQLDMFFPFDPYLLKHSSKYITALYTQWSGPADEDESDAPPAYADDDSSDDEDEGENEEKEHEGEENEGEERQSSEDIDQLTQDFMHFTPDVEKDLNYHFSFD
jgi:RNA polymerase I-specific transcription initiation factor RRN3